MLDLKILYSNKVVLYWSSAAECEINWRTATVSVCVCSISSFISTCTLLCFNFFLTHKTQGGTN